MLLVNDDQTYVCHGREDREPRAEHDPGLASAHAQPGPQPLAVGKAAVHHGDAARAGHGLKPCTQRTLELRSQVDFRHEHQDVSPLGKYLLRNVQVDLGFAAASHAKEECGRKSGRAGHHRIDSRLLRMVQAGSDPRLRRLRGAHAPLLQSCDGARPGSLALVIRDPAQRLWKRGQDDLAQGSLVIIGGKTGKSEPAFLHRLNIAQDRLDRLDLPGVVRRRLGAFDNHCDELSTPERHDHARSDRDFFITVIVEWPLKRQVDNHPHPIWMPVSLGFSRRRGSEHEVKVIS